MAAFKLVVERWSEEDDPDASYHVECLKCGSNGPQGATQLGAAQGWNGRQEWHARQGAVLMTMQGAAAESEKSAGIEIVR